jgi:hypothetical protein
VSASKSLHALLSQLNKEVAVERLAGAQGVALKPEGGGYRAKCPFHEDLGRSLTVSPEENSWTCQAGCSGGSAVEWVMAAKNLPQRKAVEWLRAEVMMASGELGGRSKLPSPALDPLDPDLDDQGILAEVLSHYQSSLMGSPEALDFLASRGLTNPDLIPFHRLGYADRSLGYRMPAKQWKAGKKLRSQLQRLGVLKSTGHEALRGSLVVPIFDIERTILDAYGRKTGRSLRKGTPLHTSWHEPIEGVWNVAALTQYAEVIVAKSVMDGLTWWNYGFRNVVAGTPAHLVAAITSNDIDRIVLGLDRSQYAQDASAQVVEALVGTRIEVFEVRFPGEHDANSYACATEGPQDALAELLRAAEQVGDDAGQRSVGVEPVTPVPMPTVAPVSVEAAEAPAVEVEDEPEDDVEVVEERVKTETTPVPVPAVAPEAPEPLASPVPDRPPAPPEEENAEHEVRLRFGDRAWRVRGLERNTRYDTLRVNLMVRREQAEVDPRLNGFHLDSIDMYSAKHRSGYVRAAASELAIEESVVSRDLGRVLLRLEELQDEALQKSMEPKNVPVTLDEDERAEALDLLKAPDLLDRIVADYERCGVVGEGTNKLVGYLAAVSRKLADPLALLIQSSSAAGKTTLMEAILAFVPEEDRLSFSSITGQAAYYFAGGDLRHKILAIAEEEGASKASYALKLLASEGRISIASTGKDATTGRLTSHEYVVEGPISLVVSTTSIDVDPELENRAIVLEVSESRELTRAIHEQQRERETLAGMVAREERKRILHLHRNAQRLLRPLKVVNPFASQLGFPDTTTRARRDHRKYLSLIRVVTFLHQYQRAVKTTTQGEHVIEFIEVTRHDIATANNLAHRVLGRSLGSVPPQTRRLLGLLVSMVDVIAEDQGVGRADVRFTRRMVREETGWGHSQLAVHLRRLEELELIVAQGSGRGRLRVYELLYTGGVDDDGPHLPGLVSPDSLTEVSGYGANLPGVETKFPARIRGTSGPILGGVRGEGATGTDGPTS